MGKVRWILWLAALGAPLLFLWRFQLFAAGSARTMAAELTMREANFLQQPALPLPNSFGVLVDAVLYDGYAFDDADEAVRLVNITSTTIDLTGWRLSDGSSSVALPAGAHVQAGATVWVTGDATAFRQQFGFEAGVVTTGWPGFANTGDEVVLSLPDWRVVDGLVYGQGTIA